MDDRRIDYLARMLRCAASRRQLLKTLAGLVAGGVATNGARPIQARAAARLAPGTPAFARTWERTDRPVASGVVSRTWIWGPEANTPVLSEPYQESPGGARVVQYFDKARMEVTHPEGDPASLWYVTNGLLVVELMTGQLQLGDTTFERHAPAEINVAGDADDPSGPTYATMALVRLAPPRATGAIITERIDRSGHISVDPTLTVHGVTAAQRVSVPGIDHQVAAPFWAFMTSAGTVFVDGAFRTEPLFSDPFYGTGLPVTEAYWARVKVAGSARDVLLQCFERRCLTYTPGNPPGFETEAGNVGQHYYHWRYVVLPGGAAPNYVYRASWGGPFDPESGMRGPYGLDVDTDGNVYVADYDRHRIQKYTPDGLLLTSWGRLGAGDGEFNHPWGIAVSGDGNVYVADSGNQRIQRFGPGGNFLGQWGRPGAGAGEFATLTGIAAAPSGLIYVLEYTRVQVFTPEGAFVTGWGAAGVGPGAFVAASGICVSPDSTVYVSDATRAVVEAYDALGAFLFAFGSDTLVQPQGIDCRGGAPVLVADDGRVHAFSETGVLLGNIGESGGGDGQFLFPTDVAASASMVFVADADLSRPRIQVFDGDGTFRTSWSDGRRERFGMLGGLALTPAGALLVADAGLDRVVGYNSDGAQVGEWGATGNLPGQFDTPIDLAAHSDGTVYVLDRGNRRVQAFDADGTFLFTWGASGAGPGGFVAPRAISIAPDGTLYVSDDALNRIQRFSPLGAFLGQWGSTGSGAGQFVNLGGIAATAARCYVVDSANRRVQIFTPTGDYLAQFGAPGSGNGQFNAPVAVAVDALGFVYVTDAANRDIQQFSTDGGWRARWLLPSGGSAAPVPGQIVIAPDGTLYVGDLGTSHIHVFAPTA